MRIALLILEVVLEGWLREGLISPGSGPGDTPPIGVFRPASLACVMNRSIVFSDCLE